MKIIIIALFSVSILVGCVQNTDNNADLPGPSVSSEQAKQIAEQEYQLNNIESVEIRHLTKEEFQKLTSRQKELTPVYYVIHGKRNGNTITVYVSSNNVSDHFVVDDIF